MTKTGSGLVPATAFAVLLALTVWTSPARGGSDRCHHDPATNTVVVQVPSSDSRDNGVKRDGNAIVYRVNRTEPYEQCGGATVHNTDRIEFHGGNSYDAVGIDLTGGRFGPGASPESEGEPEIEFYVVRETGSLGRVLLHGTAGPESFSCRDLGVNLNADNDTDLKSIDRVTKVTILSGSGRDSIDFSECGPRALGVRVHSGTGNDEVVGDPDGLYFVDSGAGNDRIRETGGTIFGDAGSDFIVGGNGRNSIRGGPGNDVISGAGGRDFLRGQGGHDQVKGGEGNDSFYETDGNDRLWGQTGRDYIEGGVGDDHVIAGSGNDIVQGNEGDDELEGSKGDDDIDGARGDDHLDGDAGRDECDPGPGKDTLEDCERRT